MGVNLISGSLGRRAIGATRWIHKMGLDGVLPSGETTGESLESSEIWLLLNSGVMVNSRLSSQNRVE